MHKRPVNSTSEAEVLKEAVVEAERLAAAAAARAKVNPLNSRAAAAAAAALGVLALLFAYWYDRESTAKALRDEEAARFNIKLPAHCANVHLPVASVLIIHYTKLVHRHAALGKELSHHCIRADWIHEYDQEALTPALLSRVHSEHFHFLPVSLHDHFLSFSDVLLSKGLVSSGLKHVEAFRRVAAMKE
jgi:hypothetical protein